MREKVDILIMAAGGSRRFGSCKLLANFRGAPLVNYALETALELSRTHPGIISSVNLVFGGHANEIGTFLESRCNQVRILHCPDWDKGLGHSLAFGVAQLPAENAVLVMLADQPLIEVADLEALLRGVEKNPEKIICAEFLFTLGVPAVFPSHMKKSLLQLQGDKGAKALLMGESDRVVTIPISSAASDIDTPDDLQNFK